MPGEDALLLGAHRARSCRARRSSWTLSIAPISSEARAPLRGEGLLVVAALPVEVAGVDRALDPLRERVVVDRDAAALAGGHVLVVVEAEAADVADRAEHPALVAAADALAGVLDHDEVAARGRSP